MPRTSRAKKSSVAKILAIDIGGTGLKAAIVDTKGRFLTERLRVKTPKHPVPERDRAGPDRAGGAAQGL